MTEPFQLDQPVFASLANLENTLFQILTMYEAHCPKDISQHEVIRGKIREVLIDSDDISNSIKALRKSLQSMITQVETSSTSFGRGKFEARSHVKTLKALQETLRFLVEIQPSQVAEQRFSTWLNLGNLPFLPIKQDYHSFYGPSRKGLKRPDFIIYEKAEIFDDAVIQGRTVTARSIRSACVDVKAFRIGRDHHGSYFEMPDHYTMIGQVGMDDKAGARSFWCIIPPETKNLGILIDLTHLKAHPNNYAPTQKVYYKDVCTVAINLLYVDDRGSCIDPVDIIFFYDQLAVNRDYTSEYIQSRRASAINISQLTSRVWRFKGNDLHLPYPDQDGLFIYQDPVRDALIVASDEREAALFECFQGAITTGYPVSKAFFTAALTAFPEAQQKIGHWMNYLKFTA